MNPAKSFPIDQNYINLAIMTVKEQYKKEQQLHNAQHHDNVLNSYEDIYGTKNSIDVKDIFQSCKGEIKQVLVFGRAGIGKSTFCRYITYQWAKGLLWSQYELVALIPLHRLTENHYPSGKNFTLIDLVKKEIFPYELSKEEENLLKDQFYTKKTLWILDGYDEIVQNIPKHLEYLLELLLKTPHHILTSRPYLNTLSYNVQVEITGFTDENIIRYVKQFFDQIKDELNDASLTSQTLLKFLKSNLNIWGIAHIPVNLELVCSLWSNEDWSETKEITITSLYTMITTWLCRRYLTSQNIDIKKLFEDEVYQMCQKEMTFLESLAFNAMKSNTIIIRPSLLKKALNEAKVCLQEHPHVLNVGILKSFQKQGIGTQIEVNKDYYFIHLSFQEYFAARYIINAVKEPSPEKIIEFIKYQRYNQRYALVFTFLAGLLSESDEATYLTMFWDNILEEPLDLVGLRQMELIILCLEETLTKSNFSERSKLLKWIAECIQHNLLTKNKIVLEHLSQLLRTTQAVVCEETVINMLTTLLKYKEADVKIEVLFFICSLNISSTPISLINMINTLLTDNDDQVKIYACEVVRTIGEKAVTVEIVNKLVSLLEHKERNVAHNAASILGHINVDGRAITPEIIDYFVNKLGNENFYMGGQMYFVLDNIVDKVATNEILNKLLNALKGPTERFRSNIYHFLIRKADKLVTTEMINKLADSLGNIHKDVRSNACHILAAIARKIEIPEVINKLVKRVLKDKDCWVRLFACSALQNVSEEVMTTQVLTKLLNTLKDRDFEMRAKACFALGQIGRRAATEEVISALKYAKQDENANVRGRACEALVRMREGLEISEMVNRLSNALRDTDETIRANACTAIREIVGKAPTAEVLIMLESALKDKSRNVRYNACITLLSINETAAIVSIMDTLISGIEDESEDVRAKACEAIGRMGERVATTEVIRKIMSLLGDASANVRATACDALQQMGEKAATIEVIRGVVNAMKDQNLHVREKACWALQRWSAKVMIPTAIDSLVDALADESERVRHLACCTLEKMIKQVFKYEIIGKLMSAMEDERVYVRVNACFLLGQMEEKAATIEVIDKLMNALTDNSSIVRRQAFDALKNLSEKIVPTKVIDNIVNALVGNDCGMKMSAWHFLQKISDKITTREIISKLIVPVYQDDRITSRNIAELIGNSLKSSHLISELGASKILEICSSKFASICLKNVSEEQLIEVFLIDKISDWPSAIIKLAVVRKTAVTITTEKFVLYGRTEPVELSISELESQQLVKVLNDQRKSLRLFLQSTSCD
jgi:HEAT repeat protein